MGRQDPIISDHWEKVIEFGPSHFAWSGSGYTSEKRPSAPAAVAARAKIGA